MASESYSMVRTVCCHLGVFLVVALASADRAPAQAPPLVEPPTGGVGLHVPLDDFLNVNSWGVNQFLGNGLVMDGIDAYALDSGTGTKIARYQTSVESGGVPVDMPTGQDWAISIDYKHNGAYSSANNPFLVKKWNTNDEFVALFNDGGDSWSLGVGKAGGGHNIAVSNIQLGDTWNRFTFDYDAATQTFDAWLNNDLLAADLTVGHGNYNVDHVQIRNLGAGDDYFGEVRIGDPVAQTRSPTFGHEWVQSNPFLVQGLVLRRFALDDTTYRDANFTNVLAWENDVGLVDKAWEKQMLPWHWHTGKQPMTPALQSQINDWVANRPGGEGFLVWDEPNRPDFHDVAEFSDWIKETHPGMLVYGNMQTQPRPGSIFSDQFGSTPNPPPYPYDYDVFLDDYLYVVRPDMLSFSLYPITDDPTEPIPLYLSDRYYRGMEAIRSAGLRWDIPYKVVVQSFDGGGTRLPTDASEMRFQAFTAMAYGMKAITYFTFDHFGSFASGNDGGMLRAIDPPETMHVTNEPIYSDVQALNPEISRLGETLKMMDSTQVRYILGKHDPGSGEISNTLPMGVTQWDPNVDEPYITSIVATYGGSIPEITEGDLVMGHFETRVEELDGPQYNDELYFMLVNTLMDPSLDATQQIRIDFDFGVSGITALQRLNRLTGLAEDVPLAHDGGSLFHLDWTLAGGDADLFKYKSGAKFIIGDIAVNADFDGSGVVDGADMLVWQRNFGTTSGASKSQGDADDDGDVDSDDLFLWGDQFGLAGTPLSAANLTVPEPSTALAVFLCLGVWGATRPTVWR